MASLAGEEGKKQQGCDNEAFLLKKQLFPGPHQLLRPRGDGHKAD